MALKGDYDKGTMSEISFFCNDTTADRGGCMVISTVGSGVALDQSAAVATYAADPSGKAPLGILMCDVVNKDLTQTHLDWYKYEVQTGSKVEICGQGWFTTDRIYPGSTPAAGNPAYVAHSGYISPTRGTSGQWPLIGQFRSSKDENGFAKVYVNVPTQANSAYN